jgi:hypothetical protein
MIEFPSSKELRRLAENPLPGYPAERLSLEECLGINLIEQATSFWRGEAKHLTATGPTFAADVHSYFELVDDAPVRRVGTASRARAERAAPGSRTARPVRRDLWHELSRLWLKWHDEILGTDAGGGRSFMQLYEACQARWERTPQAAYGGLSPAQIVEGERQST